MKVEERDPNRSRDRKGVLHGPLRATKGDEDAQIGSSGINNLEHSLTVAALPEVHLP